ncbi:MAG: hypothetical protein IJT98_08250, partial [Prevotella sp.]|nr:hypothetical protein [Prevotella sp.]
MLGFQEASAQPVASVLADADSLLSEGRACFERRQGSEALACFEAVAFEAAYDVTQRIRALNNSGCVYKYLQQDYIKSYERFSQAYSLCDSACYDEFMPVIMVNMGDLISDYGAISNSPELASQARDIFEQCIDRAFAARNWELVMTAFFNLSNQNFDLPLDNYRRLMTASIPDSIPDLQYVRLQYRAIEKVQQGLWAEARQLFLQQPSVVSARWEPGRDSIATYMSIAYTYRMESDYAHETAWLEKAEKLAQASGISDQAATISHLLVESRAQLLDDRQHMQQYVIIAIAAALLAVLASTVLLWRKNRKLNLSNHQLYQLYQQQLQAEREEQQLRKDLVEAKYSGSSLSSEHKDALIYRIQEVLSTADAICQPDFTLAKLAKMSDSNTTYVSQVINEHYGTSFSNVLSGMRIREACRRMSEESSRYRHVTIEAIALSV